MAKLERSEDIGRFVSWLDLNWAMPQSCGIPLLMSGERTDRLKSFGLELTPQALRNKSSLWWVASGMSMDMQLLWCKSVKGTQGKRLKLGDAQTPIVVIGWYQDYNPVQELGVLDQIGFDPGATLVQLRSFLLRRAGSCEKQAKLASEIATEGSEQINWSSTGFRRGGIGETRWLYDGALAWHKKAAYCQRAVAVINSSPWLVGQK